MKFALIGEKLGHSYSAIIHNALGAEYELVELKKEDIPSFVANSSYAGFNVTVPYKREIMGYLDAIAPSAEFAGAVNTCKRENGKITGYNTDVDGMRYMLSSVGVTVKDQVVMILGTGGTSHTALALCKLDGAKKTYVVGRNSEINYTNCYLPDVTILINATPVGMYPNVGQRAVDVSRFPSLIGVFDCVYNPFKTLLILDAEKAGLKCASGLGMLVTQAVKAEEIWTGVSHEDKIPYLINKVAKSKLNVILEGMPACGKTTVGKALAEKTGREFIDVDEEIFKKTGRTPAEMISTDGESFFREVESEVVKAVAKESGKVIALGGGSVLREENVDACKQNGVIVYIDRPVERLVTDGRPLSQKVGVGKLFEKRSPIYEKAADVKVDGSGNVEDVVHEIMTKLF